MLKKLKSSLGLTRLSSPDLTLCQEAKMFSANVAALRTCVENRESALRQKHLEQRRTTVIREILRASADGFIGALEDAIADAHTHYGYSIVLRTWSVAEISAVSRGHSSSLLEVFRETDVLTRLGNCLAPGHFKCDLRKRRQHRDAPETYDLVVRFVSAGFAPDKPACCCIVHDLVHGWCDLCGGYGTAVMNPEDED